MTSKIFRLFGGSLFLALSLSVQAVPVNLSTWTAFSLPGESDWQVQPPDNDKVLQTINGGVTTFFDTSALNAQGKALTGRISVGPNVNETFNDDAFIGFVLGVGNGTGNFYLIDWKQADQGAPGRGEGLAGLAFTAIRGGEAGFNGCRYWDHGSLWLHRCPLPIAWG